MENIVHLRVLGMALAIINVTLWFSASWIRTTWDQALGRTDFPHRPFALDGVQELLNYFDPWLARGLFPVVFTFGFAAAPALLHAAHGEGARTPRLAIILLISLVGLEAVWLSLLAIGIFCRGPNWNFYWPWEAWDLRVVFFNRINLSDAFWVGIFNQPIEAMPWWLREAPGSALLVGYLLMGVLTALNLARGKGYIAVVCGYLVLAFLLLVPFAPIAFLAPAMGLCLVATYLLMRALGEQPRAPALRFWRGLLLVLILQAAALVPVKILLTQAFNVKYVVFVPEYYTNI